MEIVHQYKTFFFFLQTDFLLRLESTPLHITRMTDEPVFRQIVKVVNA